jgi:hypothetical protein
MEYKNTESFSIYLQKKKNAPFKNKINSEYHPKKSLF